MNKKLFAEKKVRFKAQMITSVYNNQVILANVQNGMCFKMTAECFEILKNLVEQSVSLKEFFGWFEENSDKKYFENILKILLEYKLVEYGEDSKEDEPYSAVLVLTNRCNLRCNHCCVNADAGSDQDILSLDDWKKIIDKMRDMTFRTVIITGGEALVRSDFFEIVSYAKEALTGDFILMTNATLINTENAKELISYFKGFSISLDGVDEETCAPVRGKGVFARTMKGIEILKAEGMKDFSLSFTKVKQNAHCVEAFKKMAKDLGAEPMIRNFDVVGRAKEHLELLPDDIDEQFRPILSSPHGPEGHYYPEDLPVCASCNGGIRKFCISHNGDIYPCQVLSFPEFKMANIMELDSLRDFYTSEQYSSTEGFKNLMETFPPYSESCKDCPAKTHCTHCVLYSYLMKNRSNYKELCNMKIEGLMPLWK